MQSHRMVAAALISAIGFAFGTPAYATAMLPTCEEIVLSPEQRAEKSDVVFDGKVETATCSCMPLASGDNSFGGRAECTDVIDVLTPIKGTVGSKITIKNVAVIDPDPKADLSHSECESKISDRNDKLVGVAHTYFLKQSGEFYDPVSASGCN